MPPIDPIASENPENTVPLVEMKGITRFFPPNTTALRNVECTIFPGQTVAIIGPSGSGKSTLLALLGLLDSPDSGTYTLSGNAIAQIDQSGLTALRRDLIGYVFQSFNLIDYLSVRENILHALDIKGVHGGRAAALANEKIRLVGLSHRADAYPSTLSGGEQQRTAIARAIAGSPKLLLCDEPTGNLDSENSASVLKLLLSMSNNTNAIIIVTHDETIAAACNRQLRMADGHLQEISVSHAPGTEAQRS